MGYVGLDDQDKAMKRRVVVMFLIVTLAVAGLWLVRVHVLGDWSFSCDISAGNWGPISHGESKTDLGYALDYSGYRGSVTPTKDQFTSDEKVRFTVKIQNTTDTVRRLHWGNGLLGRCLSYALSPASVSRGLPSGKAVPNPDTTFEFTRHKDWEQGTIVLPPDSVQQFDIVLSAGTLSPGEHPFYFEYLLVPVGGGGVFRDEARKIRFLPVVVKVK